MKTVKVGMYADQTGLFTEYELYDENFVELIIPEWIVRKWYEENDLAEETADVLGIPIEEATFEKWLDEVSYGDDTDGLFDFAIDNGSKPTIDVDVNKKDYVFYRDDETGFKTIIFEGNYNDCRYFGRENGWEFDGHELSMWEP